MWCRFKLAHPLFPQINEKKIFMDNSFPFKYRLLIEVVTIIAFIIIPFLFVWKCVVMLLEEIWLAMQWPFFVRDNLTEDMKKSWANENRRNNGHGNN